MSHDSEVSGCLVVVVGPSGAGKDSLLDHARRELKQDDRIVFVRRVITRPSSAGGEDHLEMDADTFAQLETEGAFSVTWQAHNLRYALPGDVRTIIAQNRVAVANGSRAALQQMRKAFPDIVVVTIQADKDIRAMRLAARGRETENEIRQRLAREVTVPGPSSTDITIENNGDLAAAGSELVHCLRQLAMARSGHGKQSRSALPGTEG